MHAPNLDPCLYHMLRYLPVALLSLVNNDLHGLMKYTMSCHRYDNLFFTDSSFHTSSLYCVTNVIKPTRKRGS